MRVLWKPVGLPADVVEIPDDDDKMMEAMQELVGGYTELVLVSRNIYLICNEEGKLRGLLPNCYVHGGLYVGNVFFIGRERGGFRSITDDQIRTAKRLIRLEPNS